MINARPQSVSETDSLQTASLSIITHTTLTTKTSRKKCALTDTPDLETKHYTNDLYDLSSSSKHHTDSISIIETPH